MAVDGRFSLIQTPQALPGTCGGCGKAKWEQGFIDTDLQFDFYGALIFCGECVLDMASKLGLISPEAAEYLQNRVNELEAEAATQRKALLLLEEALDGIQTARNLLGTGPDNSGDKPPAESVAEEIPSFSEIVDPNPMAETPESSTPSGNSEINDNPGEQESARIPEPATEFADAAALGIDL